MDNNIPEIEELIKQFSKLPGLGPKSAKRIILKLINNKENMVKPLAQTLAKVYKNVDLSLLVDLPASIRPVKSLTG